MVYLAFGLLGLGAVLILAGLLSGQRGNSAPKEEPLAQSPVSHVVAAPPAPAPAPPAVRTEPIPDSFVKHPREAPPEPPSAPRVDIHVARENPHFFRKEAYLYLDHSAGNTYDGTQNNFHIMETENIRRFGKGVLSYDGFSFYFQHKKNTERFPVESIEQAAFYPNCIALVPKSGRPTALFFVDSTTSIRSILDTFRIENVS